MLAKLISWFLSKSLENKLMSNPETRKDIEELRALNKSMKTRLDRIKKDNPELYKRIMSDKFVRIPFLGFNFLMSSRDVSKLKCDG